MSSKIPRNQRRKQAEAARPPVDKPTPGEVVRRRRNRRFAFLAVVAVLLPLLEVVAYQFRSIAVTLSNESDEVITGIKYVYPGGSFEVDELKSGAKVTHLTRPNYTFTSDKFSTYAAEVVGSSASGRFRLNELRNGTIDYSARETYAIEADKANGSPHFKHTTRPGFPLGSIRDLLTRLGVR